MDTKNLVNTIALNTGRSPEEVDKLLDGFASLVKDYCCNMDSVAIPGFGSIEPRKRAERITVHPATGKRLLIPPKIAVRFKPSALLKQKLK